MSELHRQFPQSPESERGVLSALLLAPNEVRALCLERGVTKEAFYLPAHQHLFDVMAGILDGNRPLEFLGLMTTLRDRSLLETIGGPAYLNELSNLLPSAAYVSHHIEDLLNKRKLRDLIAICHEGSERAWDNQDAGELIARVHGDVGKLIHQRTNRPTVKQVLQEIVDEVREGKDDTGLVQIPINGVHGRLKLYRGDLFVISAPTSCGKSALAAQFVLGCGKLQHRVAFYPVEMKQKQTLKRAIAQMGGNNADFVRKTALGPESAWAKGVIDDFMEVAKTIAGMNIHMRDDLVEWQQIRADLRVEQAKAPFTFVLIDYLQILETPISRNQSRQQQLSEVSKDMKRLAKELDCIICVPSQQNEDGNTREARDIENDASALVKIHGDKDDTGDMRPGRVSVWKQREGERHLDLPLKFNGLLTRFEYQDKPAPEAQPTRQGHPNHRKP